MGNVRRGKGVMDVQDLEIVPKELGGEAWSVFGEKFLRGPVVEDRLVNESAWLLELLNTPSWVKKSNITNMYWFPRALFINSPKASIVIDSCGFFPERVDVLWISDTI